MLKVFIGQPIPNLPIADVIRPNFGAVGLDRWTERHVQLNTPVLELVKTPEEADFLLITHNYNAVCGNAEYLRSFKTLSRKLNKKVIVFFPGDSSQEVPIENAIVFRNSQYRSTLKKNEIILPGFVEDLGANLELKPRMKSNDKATVGFCGWADFHSTADYLKFWAKSLPTTLASLFNRKVLIKQKGLWWRRKVIKNLSNSKKINTNFIIRKSYSGNEKTIELDPRIARQEYIDNILGCDFTLCIKGDGNFSTRFFETLSLGRIPLLVDTECVLPLEEVIDYSQIILRVNWKDLSKLDSIVADFYAKVTPDQFSEMQKKARETFEKYLRLDAYFKTISKKEYYEKGNAMAH